jgi:antibiotic biosynthesis monooxygenase (ABM) superfamily enzyme
MNRRNAIAALTAAGNLSLAAALKPPTQLHVDILVEPSHEAPLRETYEKIFRPEIRKQPGFVDVQLLKFRVARAGNTPPTGAWRLIISFQTEENRQAWVATAEHQRVWPQMEKHLKMVNALVYDPAA